MDAQSLTPWTLIGILGLFAVVLAYFQAWFFEKIFDWDKAVGKERKKLSTQWHRLKAVVIGLPTVLIAWLAYGITWYAVLIWFFMAFLLWNLFDYLLNVLRNLKDKLHLGENFLDGVPWLVKLGLLVISIILLILFT